MPQNPTPSSPTKPNPTPLSQSPAWQALVARQRATAGVQMRDQFAADPARAKRFRLEACDLLLDYSKQRIDGETLRLLFALAEQTQVSAGINAMFKGDDINNTEHRPALHVALRAREGVPFLDEVREVRAKMYALAEELRAGRLPAGPQNEKTIHVVNLGIGGSDLGPRLVSGALRRFGNSRVQVHFVTNVDPSDLDETLENIPPQSAFFILTSKSFTTVETLTNAERARAWLAARLPSGSDPAAHFAAVSSAPEAARAWGIPPERVLPMWDWVGGRYSLWSAVGFSIVAAIGPAGFDELLAGARAMDQHFHTTPLEANMPAIMGMLGVWNGVFNDFPTLAILPYCHELRDLPSFLQQLQMESNGKHVNREGQRVDYPTSPIVWGSAGTVGQHSFHQLLHQGTHIVPADFIVPVNGPGDRKSREMLVANAFAQSATLMAGAENADPHRVHEGNRPSNTILMPNLTPNTLGQLLALYEHKVYVESILTDINAFDQWGVELGKKVAKSLEAGTPGDIDASTRELMARAATLRGQAD